jgi:hypothetical protein
MHRSTLVSLITADALRSTIRALGILRDIKSSGLSLPRSLRGQNNVASLRLELCRLRGLGDLLVPVSTTRENNARSERLDTLLTLTSGVSWLLRTKWQCDHLRKNWRASTAPLRR